MGHSVVGASASSCRSIASGGGKCTPMSSIQRLIDDLLMGIRNSTEKRSARCLRLTPHTTAREQANRLTLWLIGWEVETPLISGVKYTRWCRSFRYHPCATIKRYAIGLWNVESSC